MNRAFWSDKCVFLTGHTGFKGGWLALWLADMGAKVHGYALAPHVDPSLFNVVKLQDSLASSTVADIRDATLEKLCNQPSQASLLFRRKKFIRLHLRTHNSSKS